MIRLFRQRVVPTGLVDIMQRAASIKKSAPELTKIAKGMKAQADLSALNAQTIDKLARLEFALKQFVAEKGSPRLASSAGRPSRKFTVYPPVMSWAGSPTRVSWPPAKWIFTAL